MTVTYKRCIKSRIFGYVTAIECSSCCHLLKSEYSNEKPNIEV